jgi:hypothetical protein
MNLEPLSQENEREELKAPESGVIQPPPSKKRNLSIPVIAILLVVLLGVGVWAISLSFKLKDSQEQLTTLKSDYTKLQSENKKLTEDLKLANADLKQSNKDLTAAEADLEKAEDQNTKLTTKIKLAHDAAEILFAFSSIDSGIDFYKVDSLARATKDKDLLTKWDRFTSLPSSETSYDFLMYMVTSIRDELK